MDGRLKKMLEDKGFGGDDPAAWLERAADICLIAAAYCQQTEPQEKVEIDQLIQASDSLDVLSLED